MSNFLSLHRSIVHSGTCSVDATIFSVLPYQKPWLHYIYHYYRICYSDSVYHLNAMLTSHLTWHKAKIHHKQIAYSKNESKPPVHQRTSNQYCLHTATAAQSFPLENKQAGIHSRAMSKQMEQLPAHMSCDAKRKARCASRQLQKAVPDTQQNIQSDLCSIHIHCANLVILEGGM